MNESKANRYHRLRRRTSILGTALTAIFLCLLLVTGGSAALRDAAAAVARGSFVFTVVLYVVLLVLLIEAIQAPLAFYAGVTLERRYGLSTETPAHWWREHAKAAAVGAVFGTVAAVLVCGLLRWSPDHWWLMAAGCFAVVLVALTQFAPVFLLPLFYECRPLQRPELVSRLYALAERTGAQVRGVFEWRLSARTRKANAALAGIGRTRRILLSDTLLSDHSDEEIEVILAHELAHHVHHDIWSGIALESALMLLGFYIADRALTAFGSTVGSAGKSDVALLPLLLLTGGAVSMGLMPFFNALSRAHERRADRYALEITGNVPAFVSAMRRLGAQNLAEEEPSRLVEVLFYTHPPMAARIADAHTWAARQP